MFCVFAVAKWTMPNVRQLSKEEQKAYLQTLSFSHYNELARWSLSFSGISFVEHGYAPVQHVLPTLATRIGQTKDQNVANTSSTVTQLSRTKKDGSEGMSSLPLLVLPDGNILSDSWEISQWACKQGGIETAPEKLCKVLDEQVGVGVRQLIYFYMLKKENENVMLGMSTDGSHWFWRSLFYVGNVCMIYTPTFTTHDPLLTSTPTVVFTTSQLTVLLLYQS